MIKLVKKNSGEVAKVASIYHFLYKFSLEKLEHALQNKSMIFLLGNYLSVNRYSRIRENDTMMRHLEAYFEACEVMIRESPHGRCLNRIFDLSFNSFIS